MSKVNALEFFGEKIKEIKYLLKVTLVCILIRWKKFGFAHIGYTF
jgi:hypothetical protein